MSKLAAFIAAFSFVFIQFVHAAVIEADHAHHAGTSSLSLEHQTHAHHHNHIDSLNDLDSDLVDLGLLHQALHDHLTFTLQAMSLFKDPILFDGSYLDTGVTSGPSSNPAPPVPPPSN